jgi:UDP-glucose 4-epimerase
VADRLRVVVTGGAGGVGAKTVAALLDVGHEVLSTDRVAPATDYHWEERLNYVQADLTDAGSAVSVVRGADVVIHTAAIPTPEFHPPHIVFQNNLAATFNVLEAAVRAGVSRFVNLSSETVPGFIFADRSWLPEYVPVDEHHPARPQDPYALSKYFGELLMDSAVRRSEMTCASLRPSWVVHPSDYGQYLSRALKDPASMAGNVWSYVDVSDLTDAILLASTAPLSGHEVFYIAAADNLAGRPLADLVHEYYRDAVELRVDGELEVSGISCAKAHRVLGYQPTRSWRDHLHPDGTLIAERQQ